MLSRVCVIAHATLRALPDELYLASVVTAADDAIICNDRDGRITAWNAGAERMLGYKASEIVGRDISLLFTPHGQREEAAAFVQIWNGEGAAIADRVLVHKSGRRVEVSMTMSPIRDAAGGCIGASKICRHLGARKEVEIAARHLSALVASSDDAIISKDVNGIVQSWNPATPSAHPSQTPLFRIRHAYGRFRRFSQITLPMSR